MRKHAGARRVDVGLSVEKGELSIVVADDGRGLVAGNGAAAHSFGLQTMVERAESVGGRLSIDSEAQKGTRIRLWIPLLKE